MNQRQQFAAHLRGLDNKALSKAQRRAARDYAEARERGNCALAAVLYFDLRQVDAEVAHRTTPALACQRTPDAPVKEVAP